VLQPPAPPSLISPAPKRTPANEGETYSVLIQAYDAICHQQYRDAEAEMVLVPSTYDNDALVNFTLAALSGKEGRASDAVAYTQRSVEEAPDFAWGYRTLGRLQQNRLKDLRHADESYAAALKITPDLPEIADSLVELRIGQNNFDGAIDVAVAAIDSDPKSSGNLYRLALIYAQQYRNREASAELEKAIALDPNVAKYYRSRAAIKRSQGDLNDAIADEQHAVDLSKDKPFELIELAGMNQAAGNINRAADNLQDALKLDPDNLSAHNKLVALLEQEKRFDDLQAEYKRLADRKPKDAASRLGLAKAYVAEGKLDLAAKEFVEAANLDPNNPEPHRQMGALKLKEKLYGAAAKEYTAALNIDPRSVPDLVALGYAYAQNDDFPQAEAAFVTALALQQLTQPNTLVNSPERLDLMRSLASLLLYEGRYSEAAAQFQSIYASSKGTGNAAMDYFMLSQAKAYRDLSNASAQTLIDSFHALNAEQQNDQRLAFLTALVEANKPDLALPLIEDQLKTAPQDEQRKLKYLKARALIKKDQVADALKLVSDLVPADSDGQLSEVSQELVILSQLSAAANDLPQSEAQAQKAVEKYSKSYNAYIQLGRIKLKQGNSKEAIDFAKKAIELNPYATRAYMLQGDAQSSAGNVKEASASYRHAAELYPGLLEAHKSLLETLRKLSLKDEAKREEEQIAQMEKQK
jgi:tetratricopeptide (TPR) repeat protein